MAQHEMLACLATYEPNRTQEPTITACGWVCEQESWCAAVQSPGWRLEKVSARLSLWDLAQVWMAVEVHRAEAATHQQGTHGPPGWTRHT